MTYLILARKGSRATALHIRSGKRVTELSEIAFRGDTLHTVESEVVESGDPKRILSTVQQQLETGNYKEV